LRGCSINIKVKFADLKGSRKHRFERVDIVGPDYGENTESDPFKLLKKKLKEESENFRKLKFKLEQEKSDYLTILSEQHKLGIPLNKLKRYQMRSDEKQELAKLRRTEEQLRKEKMQYWHVIKRDVLKYIKELATIEAHARIKQAKLFKKWMFYANLRQIILKYWREF